MVLFYEIYLINLHFLDLKHNKIDIKNKELNEYNYNSLKVKTIFLNLLSTWFIIYHVYNLLKFYTNDKNEREFIKKNGAFDWLNVL